MQLLATLAAAALISGADADTWTWTKSGKLCAGAKKKCSTVMECTSMAIGPCGSGEEPPTRFLKSSFVGMGFLDESHYLTCTGEACKPYAKVIESTGVGYRDANVVEVGEGKYAYGMAGNVFGDLKSAGAYLGLAHYLNVGTKDITTNTNQVFSATPDSTARKDRSSSGGSPYGAPDGPYTVCISDVTSEGGCGPVRTFKPSEYKFSIFAHVSGSNYTEQVVPGQNGFPVNMTHMGVRMKLEVVGFRASELQVNDRAYDADKVTEDITSFAFKTAKGGVNFTFPTKYNIGQTAGAKTDGTMLAVDETKTVKIKIHSVDKTSLMIDYLFDATGLVEGTYLIYDPTVAAAPAAQDSSLGKNGAHARTQGLAAGMIMIILAGLASWM